MNFLNKQNNISITCPSRNCLNMPEIYYTNNIIKSAFQFKCICQNDKNTNMELKKFLEISPEFICNNCQKKISQNIFYCNKCKMIICQNCREYEHNNHSYNFYISNNDIYNNVCPEHKLNYLAKCINCNKALCNSCNMNSHFSFGHNLRFLENCSISKNDYDKINSSFEKQKQLFEKIKNIHDNFIQSLENDIQIKERIINSYKNYQSNYYSVLNLKNLNIQNNKKYENILIFWKILYKKIMIIKIMKIIQSKIL